MQLFAINVAINYNMKKYLLTIVGATGIGKTALSIKLAKHFNTEIISSDSRQFFKEMCIGTAVPSNSELSEVKHHFIQHLSIFDTYSVGKFEKDALQKLDELFTKNNIVIMVGGSGLYTKAVLEGLDDFPNVPPEIRTKLNQEIVKGNILNLQNQLKVLDEIAYKTIEISNPRRLVRALEVCLATGKPYSSFKSKKKKSRNFISLKIGLTAPRELMYNRINQRVDSMIEQGLLNEAKQLFKYKHLNALQTVGYKELFQYFEGKYDLNAAISEIKKNTRRFAKRQVTWNKKDTEIYWFDYDCSVNHIIKKIESILQND